MNKTKIISILTATILLNSTPAFAAANSSSGSTAKTTASSTASIPENPTGDKKDFKSLSLAEKKNAIIDRFSQKAAKAVSEGTMTQADADKFLADLRTAVDKWNGTGPIGIKPPAALCNHHMDDLSSLTPDQKKEKILDKFTTKINKRVADGKLTKTEGDKLMEELKARVAKWDGKDIRTLDLPRELLHHGQGHDVSKDSKDTTVSPNPAP